MEAGTMTKRKRTRLECRGGEKIPARVQAKKEGRKVIAWVKPRGDVTRRRMWEGKGSADRIASSGCIEGSRER